MKAFLKWTLVVLFGVLPVMGILYLSKESASVATSSGPTHVIQDVRGRKVSVPKNVNHVYYPYYYQNLLTVAGPDAFTRVKTSSIFDTANYSGALYDLLKERAKGFNEVQDVGSTLKGNFNLEKLIASKPDLVILANYQYEGMGEANLKHLAELGIPVVFIDYTDLSPAAHYQSTKILGDIFGQQDRARQINRNYASHLQAVKERLKTVSTKKTVYFEQRSSGTSFAQYGKAYGDNMLMGVLAKAAGADNIYAGKINGTGDVNPEYLFEQNPSAIFIDGTNYADENSVSLKIGYGISPAETQQSLTDLINGRPGFKNLKAVQTRQVYALDNHLMRTMKDYVLVEFIAKKLYPQAFADINPEQNLKDFNQKYLPDLVDDSEFLAQWSGD